PPQDCNGNAISGFTGWTRSVAVAWADPANPAATLGSDSGLKRITVTVTSPTGRVTTLVALRSNASAYQRQPSSLVTYVSWSGLTLQVGSGTATTVGAAGSTLNQIP